MKSITLNKSNFKSFVEDHPFVVVLFTADWCDPCKQFEPIFETEAARHDELVFGKVNIDDSADITDFFNIQHAPTLLAIRDQIIVDGAHGAMTTEEFSGMLNLWKTINTTEINRHFDSNPKF